MNANDQPLVLAFAADEGVWHGLLVAVASLLRLHPHRKFEIHIVDGGLSSKTRKRLETLRSKHTNTAIKFHAIEPSFFQSLPRGPNGSFMTYARLLLGSLILDRDFVVYLDSDILVCKQIDSILNALPKTKSIAAARDQTLRTLKEDCPIAISDEIRELPYLNMGVLIINLRRWQELGYQTACLDHLIEHSSRCTYWDQSAINYICRTDRNVIPLKWNHPIWDHGRGDSHSYDNSSIDRLPSIIHFYDGEKPWSSWSDHLPYRLWRKEARRCGVSPLRLALRDSRMRSQLQVALLLSSVERIPFLAHFAIPILRKRFRRSSDSVRRRTIARLIRKIRVINRRRL